ncbi:uncharacterized protein N0V89_002516 [Didymosphaeria variabile]|uniref:Uncharacterized protein n=1 Tax=Didymosphaeria variabile TaxID=1932322 RepID=A0A9W9CEL3_9PLEO|nr:uncharacterized protein N0V89_002516 [Didymosphaeria variabile]KAJ4357939.1 hypothetical protein N0V89_002516 [Didymosphaeria variabile]
MMTFLPGFTVQQDAAIEQSIAGNVVVTSFRENRPALLRATDSQFTLLHQKIKEEIKDVLGYLVFQTRYKQDGPDSITVKITVKDIKNDSLLNLVADILTVQQ